MYVESGRNPHPQGHFTNESQELQLKTGHIEIKRHANQLYSKYPNFKQLFGELLYITRPVIYILLFIKYNINNNNNKNNKNKWNAFIISGLIDLYSHILYRSSNTTLRQRQELKRRQTQWIFYLLLTPFFDKFIKNPTDKLNNYFEKNNSTIKFWILSYVYLFLSLLMLSV